MARADITLHYSEDEQVVRNVLLESYVVDDPQCCQIKFGHIVGADDNPEAVWTFCKNNSELIRNISQIIFSQRIHECPAIRYFDNKLHELNVTTELSNHEFARYTIAKYSLTYIGERMIYLQDVL